MNWAIAPQLTLTSLTGYYDLDLDGLQNGPWAGGAAPPLSVIKVFGREEVAQEFRLNAQLGAFGFTTGAFFQEENIESETTVPGNSSYGFPASVVKGSHDVDIRSAALFGHSGTSRCRQWRSPVACAGRMRSATIRRSSTT